MNGRFSKENAVDFAVLAAKRALWTMAQVALGMIVVGMPFSSIDWGAIVDVALTAGVISILKSIIVGMPEFETSGDLMINDTTCQLNLGIDEDTVKSKKSIRLKVVPDTTNQE